MARHFKIDDTLKESQRDQLVALALDRRTTIDRLHAWLLERGHKVCRGSVFNWRREIRARHPDQDRRQTLHRLIDTLSGKRLAAAGRVLGKV